MPTIRLVVLTKSSKFGGYCVAGINIASREWIRLVPATRISQLSKQHITYANGNELEILDVIEVDIKVSQNNNLQPENYIINTNKPFNYIKKESIVYAYNLCIQNNIPYIFKNNLNYIPQNFRKTVGYSLTMIKVQNLIFSEKTYPNGTTKTKAAFDYNSCTYTDMSVTDPVYYNKKADGSIYKDAILVLSLPDKPHKNGNYYKFVAAVYPL